MLTTENDIRSSIILAGSSKLKPALLIKKMESRVSNTAKVPISLVLGDGAKGIGSLMFLTTLFASTMRSAMNVLFSDFHA